MKHFLCLVVAIGITAGLAAQSPSFEDFNKKYRDYFKKFVEESQSEFDTFRKQQNERYAKFMQNSWEKFNASPAVKPKEEKPLPPVVYKEPSPAPTPQPKEDDAKVTPTPDVTPVPAPAPKVEPKVIPVKKDVITVPKPTPAPEPIAPVKPKPELPYSPCTASFYGTTVSVGFPKNDEFKLSGLSEKQLANAWKQLSSEQYDVTLDHALTMRDQLALCDWGYVKMLQAVSEKKYGKTNEAVFMQAFLLSQSGYKVRLATDADRLYVLVASEYNILSVPYFTVEGVKFYPLNGKSNQLKICKAAFDNEKLLSLQLRQPQKLSHKSAPQRTRKSKYGIKVSVSVNQNLIDFFDEYPSAYIGNNSMTRWAVYANTPLDETAKKTLYPELRKSISGYSQRDAVNKILNFVQTAFEYEYDDKVWGRDRAFFAEETLHYPYADCEDRSILFSRLVRDLMGLDVVLLYYPGHLATAVCFTEDVKGDYLIYKNKKYIVCDPTYINAPVGSTMPGMNNAEVQVVVL